MNIVFQECIFGHQVQRWTKHENQFKIISDHIKPNDRETTHFDSYDPSELEQFIHTQHKVINYQQHKTIHNYIMF